MIEIIDLAENLRSKLNQAVIDDSAAFDTVMEAFRLPKTSDDEINLRNEAIQKATIHAAKVPLQVAEMAVDVMKLAYEAAQTGNINAISDAASGLFFAKSALISACLNVRTNTLGITDQQLNSNLLESVQQFEKLGNTLENNTWQILKERGGFPIP
jgi:formiminotetrahydrofolate cyclodeaminase